MALVRIMQNVEQCVRTNTYRGVSLPPAGYELGVCRTETPKPPPPKPAPSKIAAKKKSSKSADASGTSSLISNSARRGAHGGMCIDRAVASLTKSHNETKRKKISDICFSTLNGAALDEASGVLADVLQVGPVLAVSKMFKFETFMIGRNSRVGCAHCPRSVNVVQSVAFAGAAFGTCQRCAHPRCLHCIQEACFRV